MINRLLPTSCQETDVFPANSHQYLVFLACLGGIILGKNAVLHLENKDEKHF